MSIILFFFFFFLLDSYLYSHLYPHRRIVLSCAIDMILLSVRMYIDLKHSRGWLCNQRTVHRPTGSERYAVLQTYRRYLAGYHESDLSLFTVTTIHQCITPYGDI